MESARVSRQSRDTPQILATTRDQSRFQLALTSCATTVQTNLQRTPLRSLDCNDRVTGMIGSRADYQTAQIDWQRDPPSKGRRKLAERLRRSPIRRKLRKTPLVCVTWSSLVDVKLRELDTLSPTFYPQLNHVFKINSTTPATNMGRALVVAALINFQLWGICRRGYWGEPPAPAH